jgi:2-amino-4-hydroxy-6-hydroxymethyldihydropteridine diphosphokinase
MRMSEKESQRVEAEFHHSVYISIGTNMGQRIHHLNHAVHAIRDLSLSPLECSAVYETRPVGFLEQPDFLNMVVRMTTKSSAQGLLAELLNLEAAFGRVREIRFGPRTLDLDILLYGNEYICFNHLQIPHPRMWERAFVLVPLADLIPDSKALGGKTIRACADNLSVEGDVRYVGRFW